MVDELRAIAEDERVAWNRVQYAGFSNIPEPDELPVWRARTWFDRTVAAFEGGTIVGTTSSCPFLTHVPGGGMVPTAAVTAVAVLPTHRRRGVLSTMMGRQLANLHETGESLAALWTSESTIYGRYGYGLSVHGDDWLLEGAHPAFAAPDTDAGNRVHLVDRREALERFPSTYERVARSTPGMMQPPSVWWMPQYGDGPWAGSAEKREPFLVRFERDGVDEGFATYQVTDSGGGTRELMVRSLYAATARAHEALWRFVAGIDLVDRIRAPHRAVDDALPWMLDDWRQLQRKAVDLIWLRLVDVESALAARRYSTGRVVLRVHDDFCPWNDGTYLLEAGENGIASCSRHEGRPDIELAVDSLARAYLGGVDLLTLARAGRVQVHDPSALQQGSAMFRTDRAPWSALEF